MVRVFPAAQSTALQNCSWLGLLQLCLWWPHPACRIPHMRQGCLRPPLSEGRFVRHPPYRSDVQAKTAAPSSRARPFICMSVKVSSFGNKESAIHLPKRSKELQHPSFTRLRATSPRCSRKPPVLWRISARHRGRHGLANLRAGAKR